MKLTCLPVFFAFCIPAQICYAEINEYDIEIVIFEDVSNRYVDSEQWPRVIHELLPEDLKTNTDINIDNGKVEETAGIDANDVINISSNDTGKLDKYAKIINASTRYNVLVHKAWRQAGLDAESAINIHINSKENAISSTATTLTGFNSELGKDSDKTSSSISGEIKVILGRYLHIYTDLIYKRPNTSYTSVLASSANGLFKEFTIKSHRKMRSKELHYIDHPLVGILVMALPVEKPEEKISKENRTQ